MARRKLSSFALGGSSAAADLASKVYVKYGKSSLFPTPPQTSGCPGVLPYSTVRGDLILAAGLINKSSPMTDSLRQKERWLNMLSAALTDVGSHFQTAESTAEAGSCLLCSRMPVAKLLLYLQVPHSNLIKLQAQLVHQMLLISQLSFHHHVVAIQSYRTSQTSPPLAA